MNDTADWQLELGGEVIATLVGSDIDFPWTYAKLINSPKFERFRAYFSDDRDWPETAEFDALIEEIQSKRGFVLRNLRTSEAFKSVQLNQEGRSYGSGSARRWMERSPDANAPPS